MLTSRWRAILAACSLALPAGCRGPTTYVHPDADLQGVGVVAVLPFENLSGDRAAGPRVEQLLIAELMSKRAFKVVEPGLVAKALSGVEGGARTPEDLKKIAQALGADGLLMGTVVNYREPQGRGGAEVTIHLRLVEGRSGLTIWNAGHTRNGAGFASKLLGLPGESCTELARALVREQLATLIE